MDQDAIIQYVADTFAESEALRPTDGPGAGDTFFYYAPQHTYDPTRDFPFATMVTKDYGEFDNASQLNRPEVFRLNIGLSRDTFLAVAGFAPSEASARSADYDYATLDRVMPHPIYAQQSWVCVLNPSQATFESVKPLLAEAYSRASARISNRKADA